MKVVLTAMTGSEFENTRRVVEALLLEHVAKGRADRSVEKVEQGTREAAHQALVEQAARLGATVETMAGSPRFFVRRREATYPTVEEMFVAAPALAAPKAKNDFELAWGRVALQPA